MYITFYVIFNQQKITCNPSGWILYWWIWRIADICSAAVINIYVPCRESIYHEYNAGRANVYFRDYIYVNRHEGVYQIRPYAAAVLMFIKVASVFSIVIYLYAFSGWFEMFLLVYDIKMVRCVYIVQKMQAWHEHICTNMPLK